jgi:hypothetical protein
VQSGVQQGRVDPVGLWIRVVRERDLGVDGVAEPPAGLESLEHRAVLVAASDEVTVESVDVDRLGPGRRPRGEVERGGRACDSEEATGVPGPLRLDRVVLRPGEQGERALPCLVSGADSEPQLPGALVRHGEKHVVGELRDLVAADVPRSV